MINQSQHEKQGFGIKRNVWWEGTTELKRGEPLCYNTDFGTATDADGRRAARVERPTVSNSRAFAGVSVDSHAANTTKRMIEIYVPGSRAVPVALAVDTTINTGLLSFVCSGRYNVGVSTGLGTDCRFYSGKYPGRGSAIPRQTVTALLEDGTDGATISVATDGVTLTVADSSDMSVGDTVLIFGGEDDGTGTAIPGKYELSSITNATTVVLTGTCVDATPGAALTLTAVIYTGNPTALCDLLEGDECGGIEFLNLPNAGGSDQPHMVGGLTYVCGGLTLAADAEVELAQGTRPGLKKAFILLAALTTSDFVVDLVTAGIDQDGSTALAEVNAIDAAADAVYLTFHGSTWHCEDLVGGATQA